jgi:hypothetical protein
METPAVFFLKTCPPGHIVSKGCLSAATHPSQNKEIEGVMRMQLNAARQAKILTFAAVLWITDFGGLSRWI